jgi:hypothetical protein
MAMHHHHVAENSRLTSLFIRSIEVWLVISAAEVIHGVARTVFLQPFVGDFPARQISVFTGSLIIVGIAFLFRRWIGATDLRDCAIVGATWVVLTVGFEIFLGRVVLDLTWERILSDYNIARGGLMLFGLMVMFLAPLIALKTARVSDR